MNKLNLGKKILGLTLAVSMPIAACQNTNTTNAEFEKENKKNIENASKTSNLYLQAKKLEDTKKYVKKVTPFLKVYYSEMWIQAEGLTKFNQHELSYKESQKIQLASMVKMNNAITAMSEVEKPNSIKNDIEGKIEIYKEALIYRKGLIGSMLPDNSKTADSAGMDSTEMEEWFNFIQKHIEKVRKYNKTYTTFSKELDKIEKEFYKPIK